MSETLQLKSGPSSNGSPSSRSRSSRSRVSRRSLLLEGQNEVFEAIARGVSLDEASRLICLVAQRLVAPVPSVGALQLLDPVTQKLRCLVTDSLPETVAQQLDAAETMVGDSLAALAIRAGQVLAVDDFAQGNQLAAFCNKVIDHGLRSGVALPVFDQSGGILGAISLFFVTSRPIGRREREVLEMLAPLARIAIELHRRAEALRSADERFKSLAANVPGVVYQRIVSPDGDIRYTYISEGVRDLFGIEPEAVLADARVFFDRQSPEYAATFRDRLLAASRDLKMWDVEASIVTHDGRQKYTHAIARPLKQPDGSVVWNGLILDATRIKQAEIAAAASEAKTRQAIIESISNGIAIYDGNDRLVAINSAYIDLYPSLRDTLVVGATYAEIARAEIIVQAGEATAIQIEAQLNGQLGRHGQPTSEREQAVDDRWILISERRMNGGGTVVVQTDITDLKRREEDRRLVQEQFYRSQKTEAVGRLAGGIAHDFNNLLASILGNAGFLVEDLGEGSEQHGFARQIVVAADRARSLVQQILSFSRNEGTEYKRLDSSVIVRETAELLRATLPSNIALNVRTAPTPAGVLANATKLSQVIMNLCVNARDAIGAARGAIDIDVGIIAPGSVAAWQLNGPALRVDREVGKSEFVLRPVSADQSYVRILVRDTGCGFDPAVIEKAFEPFFTTKEVGKGTGLGLTAVDKIVAAHQGAVTLTSQRGVGSTFEIFLPLVPVAGSDEAAVTVAAAPRGTEAILIVDDEEQIGTTVSKAFERLGYKPTYLSSASHALSEIERTPDRWDLVITDQTMPEMTGFDFAKRLLERHPGFPVIMCSGFSETVTEETALQIGIGAFLRKPVESSTLAQTARRLLDGGE